MKSIKCRLLKKFRSIPSIYTPSKQHIAPLYTKSSDESPQNPPNQMHQEHKTSFNDDLHLNEQRCDYSNLCSRNKNGHIISSYHLEEAHNEVDIFQECESEFDSMPDLESSSSDCESNDNNNDHVTKTIPKSPDKCSQDLSEFELRCPPGGSDKVILYTTSLRGIRKTYEDCHTIKFLLESYRVVYIERDVSMHVGFRDELWMILGGRIIPPKLFIKGRHIGGADEVMTLHEHGMLQKFLEGIPVVIASANLNCSLCTGVRFLLCVDCNGSCKIYKDDEGNDGGCFVKCTNCNENGLVKCPNCSQ